MPIFTWAQRAPVSYEVSSKGDRRFSAFNAVMPDGRSLEVHYQCDIKGYDPGGIAWRYGKGKPPLGNWPGDTLYEAYRLLWWHWSLHNSVLMQELYVKASAKNHVLTDTFASTPINQARALADILNIGDFKEN